MRKFNIYPACSHSKKDCAARCNGRCSALEDTNFGDKECPFYMDVDTKTQRIADCYARLLATGYILKTTR